MSKNKIISKIPLYSNAMRIQRMFMHNIRTGSTTYAPIVTSLSRVKCGLSDDKTRPCIANGYSGQKTADKINPFVRICRVQLLQILEYRILYGYYLISDHTNFLTIDKWSDIEQFLKNIGNRTLCRLWKERLLPQFYLKFISVLFSCSTHNSPVYSNLVMFQSLSRY